MADVVVVGSFVQDLAFRTATFPSPGETRIGTFAAGPGGKGFNQAIACSRLGAKTAFLAATGDDGFARDVRDFLRHEKLEATFEQLSNHGTGAASIVVNQSGQNLITVALGANEHLSPAFIRSNANVFQGAKVVVAQLESSLAATRAAFAIGKENGARLILNPAPINNDIDAALAASADILVPNETEAMFLMHHLHGKQITTDLTAASDEELQKIARTLSAHTVVITLGAAGVFVSPPDGKPYRIPAINVKTIDTTGAGDAFTGALAAALLRFPDSFASAVRFAVVSAGLSTERPGTAPAMPHLDSVMVRWQAECSAH